MVNEITTIDGFVQTAMYNDGEFKVAFETDGKEKRVRLFKRVLHVPFIKLNGVPDEYSFEMIMVVPLKQGRDIGDAMLCAGTEQAKVCKGYGKNAPY